MASARLQNAPPSDKAVLPSHVYRFGLQASSARTYDLAEIPIADGLANWLQTFVCAIYQLFRASIGQMSTSLSPATQW
jgi:hypothetical protein